MNITPADHLTPEAKKEFVRIVESLGDNYNPLDKSLIEDYAQTYADVVELTHIVDFEGIKLVSPRGGEYLNPSVAILQNRRSALARLRNELGFTPKSRKEQIFKKKKKGLREEVMGS